MMTMKTSSVNSSTMRINANFARIALGLCLLLLATLTTISIEIDFDWWSTTNSQSNRRHRPLFEAYVQCSLASIWLLLQTLRSSYRRHCWRILCSGWDSFPPDGYAPLNQSEIKSTDSPDCNNDAISPLIGLSSVTSLRSNRTLKPALKVGFGVNPSIEVPDSTTKAISHDSEASEIDECKSPNPEPSPFLTDSIWIPLNPSPVTIEERFSSTGGGGDLLRSNPNRYSQHHDELTDDLNISNCDSDNTQKRVRFSKLTEVRFLTCDWSKSASFFLFAPSNWALTSSLTDSNTIDLTANQIDLSPSISLPITPATSSVPFVNAIRKSINCCLLWFLFCYCVLLLRPDHQTLFTLYVFLAYLLLFMLFFQMLIFDSSPPVERISLYKIILFALAMLSVHFLFVSTQPIDSNVPLTSDTTTVGPTKMHNEILDSSERSRIESPLLPAAESWLAVDEEHVHGLHAMQHAGEQPLHKDSSKSEQMTVQTQSTKFDYKHMLLIILTAFCGSFYLCNLRRSNDSNEIFCVFTFVGTMGLLNLIMMFPIVMVTHFWIDGSTLPDSAQLVSLVVKGVIAQLVAHPLWLWGCSLTSTHITSMFIVALIPLKVVLNLSIWSNPIDVIIALASFVVLLILFVMLTHYEQVRSRSFDPINLLFQWCHKRTQRWNQSKSCDPKWRALLRDQDFD